jgi:hypothetical protein
LLQQMPSLMRFLTVVVVLAALAAAAVVALATMVQPNTREMTIRIPANKLDPNAVEPATPAAEPEVAQPAEPVGAEP